MKAIRYSWLLLVVVSGCSMAPNRLERAEPAHLVSAEVASPFFDVGRSLLPGRHRATIVQAIGHVDATLAAEPLLARLRAKSDWTFAEPHALRDELVRRIREQRDGANARVRPSLSFYTPPAWGRDPCGGWSWGRVYRTKATGCTDGAGKIRISLPHLPDDPLDLAEFLAHEWMHAAGYGHGGNDRQESAEKRNSVPIHVGCLVRHYPDEEKMDRCALPLDRAERHATGH